MLHGLNFSKLVFLSTLVFTYSNASNYHILQYQGPVTLGVRRAPNQTDSNVTFSRSCDQGKITKKLLKDNYGRLIDFELNFKTILFQLA